MGSKIGFDSEKYMQMQKEKILERIERFNNKLYLEFGGKLFDDFHASRVLPGFKYDAKIRLLETLKDKTEVIFVISAGDIERNKIRADHGITYGMEVIRLIDKIRALGIYVNSVVITRYNNQPSVNTFINKLNRRGEKTYIHTSTKGYPTDVDLICSEEGYGANPYVETSRPLVVVTAPGPGSGKLATCLSQLYHEYKRGVKAGYAKFETFPIWNLPLKHPCNVAYESATADLKDVNIIDSFHLDAYGVSTVNYNRDVESFPLVRKILGKITGDENLYRSPTDMGVNMVGNAIIDDEVVRDASYKEIVRRYYSSACDYKQGLCDIETSQRAELLMNEQGIDKSFRKVVLPTLEKSKKEQTSVFGIEIETGEVITGKASTLLSAVSSCVLNAIKALSGIADDVLLMSPDVLEPILKIKKENLREDEPTLTIKEVLIA